MQVGAVRKLRAERKGAETGIWDMLQGAAGGGSIGQQDLGPCARGGCGGLGGRETGRSWLWGLGAAAAVHSSRFRLALVRREPRLSVFGAHIDPVMQLSNPLTQGRVMP